MKPERPGSAPPCASTAPESAHRLKAGFNRENVPAEFHITRHAFVVDIETQAFGNVLRLLGQFFGVVGSAAVFAAITILQRLACLFQVAAVVAGYLSAQAAMFGNDPFPCVGAKASAIACIVRNTKNWYCHG